MFTCLNGSGMRHVTTGPHDHFYLCQSFVTRLLTSQHKGCENMQHRTLMKCQTLCCTSLWLLTKSAFPLSKLHQGRAERVSRAASIPIYTIQNTDIVQAVRYKAEEQPSSREYDACHRLHTRATARELPRKCRTSLSE